METRVPVANRDISRWRESATQRFLICDTSPLTPWFYSLEMFGRADPGLEALARRPCHHTFLCADDFAFPQDGTRRDPAFRTRGQNWDREHLALRALVQGSLEDRIARTRAAIGA